ncbi:MAG: 16S rRNA (cytidine(1402)-2'-O)-methyltransferase [Frankiaceae bacterium]
MAECGRILVCGTPIGNAADAGRRLAAVLATADVVAAEDTRRLRRLAATLGIDLGARVVSYYDAVEARRVPELLAAARAGSTVALVTDAGMPAVSDPGYRLVAAAAAAGIPVSVIPGPSAATAALAVSGLPSDRWVFEGFLPRRPGARRARLDDLAAERRTIVLLEAPHRVAAALADLVAVFGAGRHAVLCRELTKTHEEIVRGGLGELAAWADEREVLGEVTLVVAGAPAGPDVPSADELRDAVDALVRTGLSRRDAVAAVARDRNLPRKLVYAAAVTGSDT